MKLYHATSAQNIDSIKSSGLFALSYLTNSRDLANYYSESITDEGDDPVVLEIDLDDLLDAIGDNHIVPDDLSITAPISSCLDVEKDEVIKLWNESTGSWEDSLHLVKSVRCLSAIPPHLILIQDTNLSHSIEP